MIGTIKAKNAVVWVNHARKQVYVTERRERPPGRWSDPIGAAYSEWSKANDKLRVQLMQETAIELAARGFDINDVLIEFVKVEEYLDLGRRSYPMCRAITTALTGKTLEPNTMDFDELLVDYKNSERIKEHDKRVREAMAPVAN